MSSSTPTYSSSLVQPFREELTSVGFKELLTPEDVDSALKVQDDKIILVVLNSVCGCAAGTVRPGVILSMLNELVPDAYFTLFAGMEKEAVAWFREKYLHPIAPSSPNIALFKNGELSYILQRHQVEGKSAMDIAKELMVTYDIICNQKKSPEAINELKNYIANRYNI